MFQQPMSFIMGLHNSVLSGDLDEIFDLQAPAGAMQEFTRFGLINDAFAPKVKTYRGFYQMVHANFLKHRTWCHMLLLSVYAVVLRVNIVV
jgi:hypothetical protein